MLSSIADSTAREKVYRFGGFRLDRRSGLSRLHDNGQSSPIFLGSRAVELLVALAEQAGELVTKQTLIDAVWPGTVVEDANLTVQISNLRRVLDAGRTNGSCIQTIIGRGYRFLPAVTPESEATDAETVAFPAAQAEPAEEPPRQSLTGLADCPEARPRTRRSALLVLTLISVWLGGGVLVGWHFMVWQTDRHGGIPTATAPRLSVVILPFQNLSGNPSEDYLADAITDDLTTDMSHIPEAFVIARESAYTYKGKATDVRQIGRELGVRYVLEGSVRRLDTTLRVNAQLVSAETGLHLWSDRFDQDIKDLADGQQRAVARMWSALGISMVDIERSRSERERPANPDAFDLILQARALRNQPYKRQRIQEALALYERALLLDPRSALALSGVAYLLGQNSVNRNWSVDLDAVERIQELTTQALAIAPVSEDILRTQLQWLLKQERWRDASAAAQRFIEMFPNSPAGYFVLGVCKTYMGSAAESLSLNEKMIRLNPRGPGLPDAYYRMGFASLVLGLDADAIAFIERSWALNPDINSTNRQNSLRHIAGAYQRMGDDERARWALAEANRIWPFDTVRGHWPEDPTSAVYVEQIRSYQDALRRTGLRDHVDEDADFGVASDPDLHLVFAGLTPTTVVGAQNIRTSELVALLAERKPLVIDTLLYFWGRSIPGAVGLMNAGGGGSLSGPGQDRLRRAISALTGGDLSKSIVAVGWNAERFDGRNLALRLAAMGYTNVYWYRGGREAWEVNDLPETELAATDW